MQPITHEVKDFWESASCGEKLLYQGNSEEERYRNQLRLRYEWEPEIPPFAEFDKHSGQKLLEIGVGMGADHQMFAEGGAIMHGVDLTQRALEHTRKRFRIFGLTSQLQQAEAENLPFDANEFDVVYSWGVILHCPDIQKAVDEIYRVLKPGGITKVMIYHKYSMVGYMLWLRYALLRLRPWRSLYDIYFNYLESKGTQAFTQQQARQYFSKFRDVTIYPTKLTKHDLLLTGAGQRHQGPILRFARRMYPRALIRWLMPNSGIFMLIRAVK
jgi:ubiquinone/menaquinone biosynthesis C-methylase UbiE